MDLIESIRDSFAGDWLPRIYRDRIRTQRTRSIKLDLPPRENAADILYTLLGIEIKVGKRRFACPDLATARYMRVFARLGSPEFAVPYDITKISVAADELETSWQRMMVAFTNMTADRPARARSQARNRLVTAVRAEIAEIGAGEAMPAFDTETRFRG